MVAFGLSGIPRALWQTLHKLEQRLDLEMHIVELLILTAIEGKPKEAYQNNIS